VELSSPLDRENNQKYRMLFMLAIFTGARQGELLGLKWGDMDWKNRQIYIRALLTRGGFWSNRSQLGHKK
jgi:integrase